MSEDLKIILTPSADTSRQAANRLNRDIKQLQNKVNALNINSKIDISNSSISEINKQISFIQKQIKPLKLDIEFDQRVLKTLDSFSKSVENQIKAAKQLNKTIEEQTTITKKLDGSTEKTTRQYKQNGEIIQKTTKHVNEQTQALQKQAQVAKQAQEQITKYGQTMSKTTQMDPFGNITGRTQKNQQSFRDITYKEGAQGNVESIRVTDNIDKQRKAIEKLESQLQQLKRQGEVSAATLSRVSKSINSAETVHEIDKISQRMKLLSDAGNERVRTRELEKQLDLYKRQAAVQAQNLKRRYGGAIVPEGQAGLENYLAQVNALNSKTPGLSNQMKSLNMNFKEISADVNTAASHVNTFGEELQTAMARTVTWGVAMTGVYGSLNAFRNITDQIIEIDTLMTDIRRVMDMPDSSFNDLLQESIDLSSELGNKTSDLLVIMNELGRMGYEGNQLIDLGETAQTLSNISDLSPDETVKSLSSAMVNFNIAAEDTMKIADSLNQVDNQFTISTMDLSNSIMKAGASAKVFGADMDELIGYTTAIGSATRESGNIIGKLVADVKSSLIDLESLTLRRGRQGASVMAA